MASCVEYTSYFVLLAMNYICQSIYWNGVFPTKKTLKMDRLLFIENKVHASLKDFTSSCERLTPFYTCQIDGTIGLSTTYLHFVPLTQ